MGLRGPGAAIAKAAREQAAELDRDLPWEKAGLTRAQRVLPFAILPDRFPVGVHGADHGGPTLISIEVSTR